MRRSKVEFFHVPVTPKFSVRQNGELHSRESSTCGQSRNSGGLDGDRWSVVLVSGRARRPANKKAFAELCRLYWYPLCLIRHRGYSLHDAQDLAQGFFLHNTDRKQKGDPFCLPLGAPRSNPFSGPAAGV